METAHKSDLHVIAAMHIEPAVSKIDEIIKKYNSKYRFYFDKVKLFFDIEPAGIIVAKENSQILGFIIVSKDTHEIKRVSLRKCYFIRLGLKSLLGYYGVNIEMLKKLGLILYANIISQSRGVRTDIPPGMPMETVSKIWAFIVMKDTRGKGVGLSLLDSACNYVQNQGSQAICVTVSQDNNVALKLYQNSGFQIISQCLESTGPSYYLIKHL
jgi:ribosomal protein S18 acetylase RimI-like enzyme